MFCFQQRTWIEFEMSYFLHFISRMPLNLIITFEIQVTVSQKVDVTIELPFRNSSDLCSCVFFCIYWSSSSASITLVGGLFLNFPNFVRLIDVTESVHVFLWYKFWVQPNCFVHFFSFIHFNESGRVQNCVEFYFYSHLSHERFLSQYAAHIIVNFVHSFILCLYSICWHLLEDLLW